MKRTISILGCGWLGFPLAEKLIERGYTVKGSTTSKEKIPAFTEKNIKPYLLKFDASENYQIKKEEEGFFNCDILIINIPPRVKSLGDQNHPKQINSIISYIKQNKINKVVYVSATSVYPPDCDIADEQTSISILNTGNKALFEAEKLLESEPDFESLILRCGGLLGYNRIPGRYFTGKTISNGETPVNYIHRDDVINIIELAIEKKLFGGLYNLVAPKHPTKKEVFSKNAEDFGLEAPICMEEPEPIGRKRLILGFRIMEILNYKFIFPDPLDFYFTK